MPMSRRWGMMLLMLCCLTVIADRGSSWAQAQDGVLDEETAFEQAARAVVRIRACYAEACEVGSGVIIDPSGLILTAWHVVALDPANIDSALYQNLEIQLSDDIARPPETRYWAQVIASKADADLALLRITYDVQAGTSITLGSELKLPWLALSGRTPRTAQLRIMGYPPLSDTLSYPTFDQSGLEEGGALLRVQNPLSRGFSGGPALLQRADGPFEIVGLVIRRRGEDVGLIRNIRELQALKWQRNEQRAWAEAIEVGHDGNRVQIHLDLHTLDLAGRQVQVRVFLFDATTNQPWAPATTTLPTTESGQVFLAKTIAVERFAEVQRAIALEAPAAELGTEPERLRFRVTLWDSEGVRNLWQSAQGYAPQRAGEAVALAPTTTTTTVTPSPTQALQQTPAPDLTATAAAVYAAVQVAIDATLTAIAPTPTPTPNFDQLLAVAVAATLTAQPTVTSPAIEATATPTPGVTGRTSATYVTIPLTTVSNNSTEEGYIAPPSGSVRLGRVPFYLPTGTNSVTTQHEAAPRFPTSIVLTGLEIPQARGVFFLITGGSVRQSFDGQTVGEIILTFTQNQEHRVALVAGSNIREWKDCCGPNVATISASNVTTVWRGKNRFDGGTAFIDMLSITIPARYTQETLASIRVTDLSVSTVGSMNPAINLIGVTVEQ
jgi:hypothetical protein